MIEDMEYFLLEGAEDLLYRYSVDLDALLERWDGALWVPAGDADFDALASGSLWPISEARATALISRVAAA